jgi:hypothetical protein
VLLDCERAGIWSSFPVAAPVRRHTILERQDRPVNSL